MEQKIALSIRALTDKEERESLKKLAAQQAQSIDELEDIEGGDVGTFLGLVLVAGALVGLTIVIANNTIGTISLRHSTLRLSAHATTSVANINPTSVAT